MPCSINPPESREHYLGADCIALQSLGLASIVVVAKTEELIPISVLIAPMIAAPLQTVSHAELNWLPYLHNLT